MATIEVDSPVEVTDRITNPIRMPAQVKLLVENESERREPLGELALWDGPIMSLSAGESKVVSFKK